MAEELALDRIAPTGKTAADVGFSRQIMGADLVVRGDGWERGVRCVQLQNDRIAIEVVVDRGLDIAGARIRQVPIGWRSATEIVAPWFVENYGFGTHRSFFGGLLKTCGLDHIGMPAKKDVPAGVQAAGAYPMHGRISGAPARLGSYGIRPCGEGMEAFVEGSVTQVAVFDEHLTLDRRISIAYGSSVIRVSDTVTNHSYHDSLLAVLYHVNVGWPVLAPGASLLTPSRRVRGDETFADITVPRPDGQSRTWLFEPDGKGAAGIANPHVDTEQSAGLRLAWDARALPSMVLWKMDRIAGNHVLALEPSTILPAASRGGEQFPVIRPRESISLGLDIELLHGRAGADLLRPVTQI